MKIMQQSWSYEEEINPDKVMARLERAARTCYKSEDSITTGSAEKLIASIIKRGHDSILEHASISIRVIADRAILNEWVRHRIGMSYSQESTRYVNYGKDRFGSEITVIQPPLTAIQADIWLGQCGLAEQAYMNLLAAGVTPQIARSVLPLCTKSEMVVTGTLRAWRHFFNLRCAVAAHPQMRELALTIQADFQKKLPIIFGAI
jgi:thymidylate synthase (FAD)